MKKLIIGLMTLTSLSAFASEVENLKSFSGSAQQFRVELKEALKKDYDVECTSREGENYGIWFSDFNSNYQMKVVCQNSQQKVKAIAKLKQKNGFYNVVVRSIRIQVEHEIK